VTRKVFLAMMTEAGFVDANCIGTGQYRTSEYTQAAFYVAQKPA
jgi:hypothetical protein